MRQQTMSGGKIDDAPAPKEAAHATRRLPCFVQLLAWQATGVTYGAREAIEQRGARKPLEITVGEAPFR